MPIKKELLRIIRRVDETGQQTISAVRDLWDDVSLTAEERKDLLQEALAGRANEALRRTGRRYSIEKAAQSFQAPEIIRANIDVITPEPEYIHIDIRILENVSFDVRGHRTTLKDLSKSDNSYLKDRTAATIRGGMRRFKFHHHVDERLNAEGVNKVSELSIAQQREVAMLWQNVEECEELPELPPPAGQLPDKT